MMLQDFSVEDLTRAFFRQFLIQNRFGKTYEAFESQDVRSKVKISKAVLIRSLCMEHLIGQNKKLEKPFKSLAEILVAYLKNKYSSKQKENQLDKPIADAVSNFDKPDLTPEIYGKDSTVEPVAQVQALQSKPVVEDEALPSRVTAMRRLNKKETKTDKSVVEPAKVLQSNTSETDQQGENRREKTPGEPPVKLVEKSREEALPKPYSGQQSDRPQRNVTQKQQSDQSATKLSDVEQPPPIKPLPFAHKTHSAAERQPQPLLQQSGQPQRKMMMFGKRKQQSLQQEKKEHDIFSKNVEAEQPKKKRYEYCKLDLSNMTARTPLASDMSYKKPQQPMRATAKKKEKPISYEQSSRLRKILFQQQCKGLPKAWCQGLLLSPYEQTYYGLEQLEGGPCGLVAALQCYYLKHLLYLCPQKPSLLEVRQSCLLAAAAELLMKMNSTKVILALPTVATVYANQPVSVQNLQLLTVQPKNIQHLFQQLYQYKTNFIGRANHGYTLLLYSCILTKGFEQIEQEMDSSASPLIGNHGHCNQQLVNLFLTGKATTNCFDGQKVFGEGSDKTVLRGVSTQQQFGFLTIFESLGYIEVGRNLKNPDLPIWVICKEFHYHVVFGNHFLVSSDNATQKFDLVYFDGLYNCKDRLVLTLNQPTQDPPPKLKDLPMIEQVLLTKWGRRTVDWNGSTPIL